MSAQPGKIRRTAQAERSDQLCDAMLARLKLTPHGATADTLADLHGAMRDEVKESLSRLMDTGLVSRHRGADGVTFYTVRP